jgi:hypothetical protein
MRDFRQTNSTRSKGLSTNIRRSLGKNGAGFLVMQSDERIKSVGFTRDSLKVDLVDGRTVTVPLTWYPRLYHATPQQRTKWKIIGAGYAIHWPDLDEDLLVEGILGGKAAPRDSETFISSLKNNRAKVTAGKRPLWGGSVKGVVRIAACKVKRADTCAKRGLVAKKIK